MLVDPALLMLLLQELLLRPDNGESQMLLLLIIIISTIDVGVRACVRSRENNDDDLTRTILLVQRSAFCERDFFPRQSPPSPSLVLSLDLFFF